VTTAPEADILSLTRSFVPRSQSWLYDEVAHLKRHSVHVATQRLMNAAEYPHSPLTVLASDQSLAARLSRLPYRICGLRPPVFCRRARKQIAALLAGGRFRLVQAHFGWVGMDIADEVDRAGLPFLTWMYGADVFHRREARRLPAFFSGRHHYCCTSHALRRRMEELGCPPGNIHVFYPGVRVPPEPPEREPSDTVRILSVGRLVRFKDPLALVRIARRLVDRGHRLSWQHLGDGPLRPRSEEAIAREGLGDSFIIRGVVPREEVLAAMRKADLMIHAAVVQKDGRRESFGVVLAEAAAAGLPIVTAAVGGIPEVVVDGTTGLLVPEGDYEAMAAKAELLLSQPELRATLGHAAHRHAREQFQLEAQVEKLDRFYDEMLS
jgi:glycosyltransferase involved in cell wall biosynthesis